MANLFTSCSLRILCGLALAVWAASGAADPASPKIVRVFPLGGQLGTEVAVEILGDGLANATGVEFDCGDLVWRGTTGKAKDKLAGVIAISAMAPLGPHLLRAITSDGFSTSAIFNVDQFGSILEREPDDGLEQAQLIDRFPVEVQGRLDGAPDIDLYRLEVRPGERKLFDLRAIEHGSAVEARMILLDERGKRVAFNDDRDDYDENPLIEHTFTRGGTYYIKLDQYRGPRGFNFGKNCAYILRISDLPALRYVSPLGLRRGRVTSLRVAGSAVESGREVYLTLERQAEYARMTYPYTMPVAFRPDPPSGDKLPRIGGKIVQRATGMLEAAFDVPRDATLGLWKVWVAGPAGIADGPSVELSDWQEFGEAGAASVDWTGGAVINGAISRPNEKDVFRFDGFSGRPMHFWTLAAQLGVPRLDTVLVLRDAAGNKLAENDDVVAGQGTLVGNPDSSLYYTPKVDGPVFLTVADRVQRGGPDFVYRLKVCSGRPGFQLFTTPENFTVSRNGTASIKVHLIREAGFSGEVSVWFDGMPPGVETPRGRFRSDQLFEPNADGADMIIPEISFAIQAPPSLAPGTYPIQVFGVATAEESRIDRRVVEAHTTTMIGPLLDLWNYVRRPLPAIAMTVVSGVKPAPEQEAAPSSARR